MADEAKALLPRGEEESTEEGEMESPHSLRQVEQAPQYSLGEQLAAWREEMARQQQEMMERQQHMLSLFSHQLQHLPGEFREMMTKNLDVMEAKVTTYTDETCTRVKKEVKEEIKVIKEEMKEELKACMVKVATLEGVMASKQGSVPCPAGPGVGWGHGVHEASSLPALQVAGRMSPPPSPRHFPSPPPSPHHFSPAPSVVCCHDALRDEGRPSGRLLGDGRGFPGPQGGERSHYERKLIEYDGKVSWDAYQAQFEAIASRQNWSRAEKAFQLVSVLKGQALEVLEHLTPAQLQYYDSVAGALRRRFGRRCQPEVFRAQLKQESEERTSLSPCWRRT